MGRRKIEIKAIKDDRNRSVTFLKRKGGLFKKAHELSVLCSVNVAVIIFGHNKKLYEYSSGDINETITRFSYYHTNGGAHEHKGPADFKGNMEGEDDDDTGTPPPEDQIAHEQSIPPQFHNQPTFQHTRHGPSASPPISNGVAPFHQRQHTPQPPIGSRPTSRNDVRRQSSSMVPPHQQVSHAQPMQNGYAYMPNPPPMYNTHLTQPMPGGPHPGSQPSQHPQYQYIHQPQPPQHPQIQQTYLQEQRRQSMPPAFPQQERSQLQQHPEQQQRSTPSPPQPPIEHDTQNLQPQQPKPLTAKSRSIFTPIDDSRSLLAAHWGIGSTTSEARNDNTHIKIEKDNRSHSVDVGSVQRSISSAPTPPPPKPRGPPRNQSVSSLAGDTSGAKRPRLKVQIPSEQSDDGGSATAASSPGGTAGGTPAKASTEASHSSGVVLPPPSPSASTLLSAGAQGPPNPFARPHPPMNSSNQNNQSYSSNNSIETPISALPSRFVADGLLPSPSSFYPEWGFGRSGGDSNMLPSPLNFQTPVVGNGPSFLRDEDGERKRKSPEGDGQQQDGGSLKRVKA